MNDFPEAVATCDGDGGSKVHTRQVTAERIEAAVVRYGGIRQAALALGISQVTAHERLNRAYGLDGPSSAESRVTLQRLIADLGLGVVAAGLGNAPADAVQKWSSMYRIPASVRRAIDRLAAARNP